MTKQVNMILDDKSIEDIERLTKVLNVRTRTLAVQNAVNISNTVVTALQQGGEVVIRDKHGKEKTIVIPGIG